jgi:CheY-like chemotaxis protein
LHPVWLLASALEGLLLQLSHKGFDFTASAQRTAASAVDLLEALCVRGLDPNLATEPRIRILAVDDDIVSRLAISLALKKVFNEPNLASEGKAALDLAVQHPYDVIFLDVQMPGMDGFELCTRIHETVRNRATPVVFVTRHSDFSSRAKSSVSGGVDLIGKPFLTFEITARR